MEKPNYYAVIPANVRYDKDLTANAKLLYGEISALCDKEGHCWATNSYFANLYGLSQISISRLIKTLKDKGYIEVKISYINGTNGIDKRYIQICKESINKNDNASINENVKENNTSINNTSITKENIKESFNKSLFDKFWNAYPKKVSKGNAEKWFTKNKPSEELVNEMIDKINLLKTTEQWKSKNGQFIPYPTTWLNAKGWEDEIVNISTGDKPDWVDKKIEQVESSEKQMDELDELFRKVLRKNDR